MVTKRKRPVKTLQSLLQRRLTRKELSRLSQDDVRRLGSLITAEADARLEEAVDRPDRDKARTAKRVAPKTTRTASELRAKVRWYRHPNRLDLEGVDAPKGSRTQFPRQKKRKRAASVTSKETTVPELPGEDFTLASQKRGPSGSVIGGQTSDGIEVDLITRGARKGKWRATIGATEVIGLTLKSAIDLAREKGTTSLEPGKNILGEEVAPPAPTLRALQAEANRFGREGNRGEFASFVEQQGQLDPVEATSLFTAFEEGVASQREKLGSFSGEPAFKIEEPSTSELSQDEKLLLALDVPALRGSERRQMLDKFKSTSLQSLERIQKQARDKLQASLGRPVTKADLPEPTQTDSANTARARRAPTVTEMARRALARSTAPFVAQAREMGKTAFKTGAPGAPAQNHEFMAFLGEKAKGQDFGFSTPLLKAFNDGWMSEQNKVADKTLADQGFEPAIQRIMGRDAQLSDGQVIDGVAYEIFHDAEGEGATLRIADVDTQESVGLKHFPTVAAAEEEYDEAIRRAAPAGEDTPPAAAQRRVEAQWSNELNEAAAGITIDWVAANEMRENGLDPDAAAAALRERVRLAEIDAEAEERRKTKVVEEAQVEAKERSETGLEIAKILANRIEQKEEEERPEDLAVMEPSPLARGQDHILTDDDVFAIKSPTRRFEANLDAIQLVKHLEEEDRLSTVEEQSVLAKYSGFGDSAFEQAFTRFSRDENWKARGERLKALVTDEEFKAIEKSRLNAFYTTPEVVNAMWQAVDRMGVGKLLRPRVLEPSAGSGRFLGLQPVEMAARSQRTAVELDALTSQMLKHLYPNADIHASTGYENAPLPNDSIDLAISNVPFGDFPVTDKAFGKGRKFLTKRIHNYFFAKTLDKLRPGGILAFITTHGTLDAPTAKPVREALAEKADLVGAIRLPKGAFPDTQVITDIVFMRKRLPGDAPGDQQWIDTGKVAIEAGSERFRFEKEFNVNQYFLDHPEMVLGTHSSSGSMRGEDEYSVDPLEGQKLEDSLGEAVQRLPENIVAESVLVPKRQVRLATGVNAKEGSFVITDDGKLFTKEKGVLIETGLSEENGSRVQEMLIVRDAARAVLDKQLQSAPDADIEGAQVELNRSYDAFVKEHGALNVKTNAQLMRLDPDGAFLRALEQPADKGWEKMAIFSQRVVKGLGDHQADNPRDALAVTLNETGGLDFERMGELLGQSGEDTQAALAREGAIYKNPVGDWEASDEYLTGNVRQKLEQAQAAAKANNAFAPNVAALGKVQPDDLTPSQIDVQLGVPWVPPDDVSDFVSHLLGARRRFGNRSRPFFNYIEQTGQWVTEERITDANRAKSTSEWGTQRMPASAIIEKLLNSQAVEVRDKTDEGKSERNAPETIAAQEKAVAIQEEFKRWIWDDPERAMRLARFYNDTFNNMRPRVFDGAHQTFPGMANKWADQLHEHQKDAIWRVVQDGTTLLAHEVGFGKSAVMVAGGMELRRLGLARKNIFVVPKATHAQFRSQFKDIYPYAKVLFPEQSDFTPDKRPEMMARIATGDWDAVIISDTQFRRLPVRPETEAALLKDEVDDLQSAMEAEAAENGVRGKTHKELQKAMVRLEERIKATQQRSAEITDDTVFFEDLGIDQMFVDEADMFKNLRFTTRMSRIKGLPNTDSQRAWDMFQKVRYLQKQGNGRGVVFATGTPIANTVAEGYTMMRYLQQPMLEERGLQHFDAWAKTFGGTTEGLEQTPTGAYRLTQRFAKFSNLPELSNLWQTTADIRVASEVQQITELQPKLVNDKGEKGQRTVVAADASESLKAFMGALAKRADNLANVDPTEDNMLKIASDARMASLDMRLVDPGASFDPAGKLAKAVDNIVRIYKETAKDKGAQLVFLDIGTPKAVDKPTEDGTQETDFETDAEESLLKDVYGDLRNRLVSAGIPVEDIAFIHDVKTDKAKEKLFDRVNKGDIRVLLGSTGKLGVGVNVQERAAALHHLDAPWRPRDIEQREGRVIRQGNKVYGPKIEDGEVIGPGPGVRIYNYVTQGSFDAYMWQAIEAKARAIKSLMRRNVVSRSIEDVDSLTISASEAKALASGNPDVMKAVQLKNDINRLVLVKGSHRDGIIRAQGELQTLPLAINAQKRTIAELGKDIALTDKTQGQEFKITINNQTFSERVEAGKVMEEIITKVEKAQVSDKAQALGMYRGFALSVGRFPLGVRLILHSPTTNAEYLSTEIGIDASGLGAITRVENIPTSLAGKLAMSEKNLAGSEASLGTFKEQADKPFEQGERLQKMQAELADIEKRLQGNEDEEKAAAKEAAEASGFFIANRDGGFTQVHDAELVAIPEFKQEFFVHRDIDGKEFIVSEASSGVSVGSGLTKAGAIDRAKERVTSAGQERLSSLVADRPKTPRRPLASGKAIKATRRKVRNPRVAQTRREGTIKQLRREFEESPGRARKVTGKKRVRKAAKKAIKTQTSVKRQASIARI